MILSGRWKNFTEVKNTLLWKLMLGFIEGKRQWEGEGGEGGEEEGEGEWESGRGTGTGMGRGREILFQYWEV